MVSVEIFPSVNPNPAKKYPTMFEPVLGSAPNIADKIIADPIRQIWSTPMILVHFGESEAAGAIERGFEGVLARAEFRTPDVGGKATTEIVRKVIVENLGKWC